MCDNTLTTLVLIEVAINNNKQNYSTLLHQTIQNYFKRTYVLCTTGLMTTTWNSMPASLSACDMKLTVTSNNFLTSQTQVVLLKREIT